MKKISFISCFLLIFSFGYSQKWSVTPELGYQSSNISITSVFYDPSAVTGTISLGIGTNYRITEKWSVNLPLTYKLTAHQFPSISLLMQTYPEFKANSIAFSPTIQYRIFKFLSAEVGGYTSYKIWESYFNRQYVFDPFLYEKGLHFSKNWDAGLSYGLRFHYKNFYLKYLFNRGLVDLNNLSEYHDTRIISHQASITLGHHFPLKRN